mgnify:CR=1 FL=1
MYYNCKGQHIATSPEYPQDKKISTKVTTNN